MWPAITIEIGFKLEPRRRPPGLMAASSVRDLPAPLAQVARRPELPGSCPQWRPGAAAAIPASANISQVPRAASWRTGRRAVGISGAPRRSAACSTRLCPRSGDLPLLNRGVARFLRTTPVDIRADNSRFAYAVLAVPDSHLEPAKPRRRLPKTSAGAFLLPPQLADSSGCFQSASITTMARRSRCPLLATARRRRDINSRTPYPPAKPTNRSNAAAITMKTPKPRRSLERWPRSDGYWRRVVPIIHRLCTARCALTPVREPATRPGRAMPRSAPNQNTCQSKFGHWGL
jgi:hypothetical protein